jgi:hypothetical protein
MMFHAKKPSSLMSVEGYRASVQEKHWTGGNEGNGGQDSGRCAKRNLARFRMFSRTTDDFSRAAPVCKRWTGCVVFFQ